MIKKIVGLSFFCILLTSCLINTNSNNQTDIVRGTCNLTSVAQKELTCKDGTYQLSNIDVLDKTETNVTANYCIVNTPKDYNKEFADAINKVGESCSADVTAKNIYGGVTGSFTAK
ncbi:hypothetical protein [Francisella frigiditurris]|uniref:Putative lipoprotein n=1 Tax=Francisella frigiditurris TaxID=1542390 RepID=A0A1J0KRP5_9GAMM|nr:hypothetical protein [Francisella frigiditurris]APC96370.1 putative lipoprotein [Francisella frigiditurris]